MIHTYTVFNSLGQIAGDFGMDFSVGEVLLCSVKIQYNELATENSRFRCLWKYSHFLCIAVSWQKKIAGCKCKLKWLDHLNSSWVTEDCESITYSDDLNALYERLIDNKELVLFPPQAINIGGPALADFDTESLTADEQEHLLDLLHLSQLFLASVVYNNTPFSLKLKKRQLILQRIYHAVSQKFHTRQDVSQRALVPQAIHSAPGKERAGPSSASGNDALVELGVKTGLSLVFALFRQNWTLARQVGQLSFTNEVLQTAITTVSSLPPLSLANENRLSPLSTDVLNQVSQFLRYLGF